MHDIVYLNFLTANEAENNRCPEGDGEYKWKRPGNKVR